MLREGVVLGAIVMWRTRVEPFTDKQIALVETFADQAVIAIENVRLLQELQARNRELTEALEQQTATAEILRVISSSPTDLQPVMDTVAENAARVCGATDSLIFRLDGDVLRWWPGTGHCRAALRVGDTIAATRDTVAGRAVRERRTIHVEDLQALPGDGVSGNAGTRARERSCAVGTGRCWRRRFCARAMPLGAIVIRRAEVQPFSARQIALLETFAHQAVIAIENVRLFTELQEKNRALAEAHAHVTEALEQQTATADILKVISGSPTAVQPVFEAIAESAARLTNALFGGTFLVSDGMLHLAAIHTPGDVDAFKRLYPITLDSNSLATRVAREGLVVNISDAETEPSLPEPQPEARPHTRGPESSLCADGAQRSGRRDDHCGAT